MGVTYLFTPPILFGLAYHDPVLWLVASLLGSLSAGINRYRHHSLCLRYEFLLKTATKSHYLWSSPILSGCSSRHPWEKLLHFPLFHPREALLVGHWVTALQFSSCAILFSSPLTEVFLHGVGLVHLSCVWQAAHTQGNANLWCNEKKSVSVEDLSPSCIGSSLCKRECQPWFDTPPPKSLLPTYPRSSSFLSKHLPSLVPGHQGFKFTAPIFLL